MHSSNRLSCSTGRTSETALTRRLERQDCPDFAVTGRTRRGMLWRTRNPQRALEQFAKDAYPLEPAVRLGAEIKKKFPLVVVTVLDSEEGTSERVETK
jgi:hypothetical protein